jgi:molybdopterin synthase catalytic subunit
MEELKVNIKITEENLSIDEAFASVQDESTGGIVLFIGSIRNQTDNKPVVKIEFSSFKSMAVKELELIAEEILNKWPVYKIAIHHRVGNLKIKEIPVIIAVSSSHRIESFQACQYAIDKLKEKVPIWKKEFFEDGAIWVNAHP